MSRFMCMDPSVCGVEKYHQSAANCKVHRGRAPSATTPAPASLAAPPVDAGDSIEDYYHGVLDKIGGWEDVYPRAVDTVNRITRTHTPGTPLDYNRSMVLAPTVGTENLGQMDAEMAEAVWEMTLRDTALGQGIEKVESIMPEPEVIDNMAYRRMDLSPGSRAKHFGQSSQFANNEFGHYLSGTGLGRIKHRVAKVPGGKELRLQRDSMPYGDDMSRLERDLLDGAVLRAVEPLREAWSGPGHEMTVRLV